MRSLAEAFLGADEDQDPHGAGQISGAQAPVHAPLSVPSSVEAPRTEASSARWPIVTLCPKGDGTILARTLARVLVRRALIQEGAIGGVDDCTSPTTSR